MDSWRGQAPPPRRRFTLAKPATTPRPQLKAPAARLLELGDRYSPTALAKARAYHDGLAQNRLTTPRVQYAFALVLLRQHCHEEAIGLLGESLAREPAGAAFVASQDLGRDGRAQRPRGLGRRGSVADVLAKQSPIDLPTADAEQRRVTVEFLGRIFGFLEVPRPNALPADELRSAKQYVLTALGDERAEFDRSEAAVAEKFSKVVAAFKQQRAKRVAEGMTKQEEVAKQKELIDETETNVDYDTEKVKTNVTTEVERLNQAAESLQKWLAACQYRLNVVRVALVNNEEKLVQQAQSSELTATGVTSGPNNLVTQAARSNQIKALVVRLGAEQNMLTQQIKQLTEQLQSTIAQRDDLLDMGEKTTAELKTQAASLKRDEKRLERAQQAGAKKLAAERHRTLLTKQTSFATFEPFPFDTEKQRVVATADP